MERGNAKNATFGRAKMNDALAAPLQADATFFENAKPRILSIYSYWQKRCGDRPMPQRADIDPADITEHLPGILLVDVEGEDAEGHGIYRYRVVGTREVANRRRDPTGERVEDGFFGVSIEATLRSYESVRRQRLPIYEPLQFVTAEGIRIDEVSILLPLSENGTNVSQILVYSENVDEKPPIKLKPKAEPDDTDASDQTDDDPAPPARRIK